jgi:EAL domain-containing protein (putative c-di-GMP-specific phosphodiesterase class I)
MLRLASELDLFVVAEGIETEEQLAHLRGAGASHGQGFHLARPMPAAELTALLQARP